LKLEPSETAGRLMLNDLQDLLARVGTVLWLSIDRYYLYKHMFTYIYAHNKYNLAPSSIMEVEHYCFETGVDRKNDT